MTNIKNDARFKINLLSSQSQLQKLNFIMVDSLIKTLVECFALLLQGWSHLLGRGRRILVVFPPKINKRQRGTLNIHLKRAGVEKLKLIVPNKSRFLICSKTNSVWKNFSQTVKKVKRINIMLNQISWDTGR